MSAIYFQRIFIESTYTRLHMFSYWELDFSIRWLNMINYQFEIMFTLMKVTVNNI